MRLVFAQQVLCLVFFYERAFFRDFSSLFVPFSPFFFFGKVFQNLAVIALHTVDFGECVVQAILKLADFSLHKPDPESAAFCDVGRGHFATFQGQGLCVSFVLDVGNLLEILIKRHEDAILLGKFAQLVVAGLLPGKHLNTPAAPVHVIQGLSEADPLIKAFAIAGE